MAAHIHHRNDLQKYGINPLTGEACAYSMRTLCDLSEKGVDLLREFLGLMVVLNPQTQFPKNWNSKVGDDPAVASFMLPNGMYGDLCKFILFHVEKMHYVYRSPDGGWYGYSLSDFNLNAAAFKRLEESGEWERWVNTRSEAEAEGSRNIHQATGRTN